MANNSFDSSLVVATISEMAMTILANRLAPLSVFTTDFSSEVAKPKEVMKIPLVNEVGAVQTDPTNFEPGLATTVGVATVTLAHLFQPFHIDASELAQGHKLERAVQRAMDSLADGIWAAAITPITTTAYGEAVVTTTTITPGSGHLATLWGTIPKATRKGLVVTSAIYSRLIPTDTQKFELAPGAYGFNNGIYHASSFTGAVSGLDGFACAPEAIAIGAAMPLIPDSVRSQFQESGSVTLEQIGITIGYNVWGATATRRVHASLELMFGAGTGLTTGTMALII
jgi:hypothetical protein